MTYAEAFARLSILAIAHGDSFSLRVEGWRHHHGEGAPTITLEWVVWSSNLHQQIVTATPEGAVEAYERAIGPVEVPDIITAVAL